MRALVLNNQFLPLSVFPKLSTTPVEDAITRYLNGKCEVVHWTKHKIGRPPNARVKEDMYWPSVIMNLNANTFKKEVNLKKESLFFRDHCACVYCGRDLTLKSHQHNSLTYDHFIPRSKGGPHSWDNVVASCRECNEEKDSSTSPHWKPRKMPWTPTFYDLLEARKKYPLIVDDPDWIQFLPKWTGKVIIPKGSSGLQDSENMVESAFDQMEYEDVVERY